MTTRRRQSQTLQADTGRMRFFATCARGIEPALASELRELGALEIEPGRGGVHFAGDQALTLPRQSLAADGGPSLAAHSHRRRQLARRSL